MPGFHRLLARSCASLNVQAERWADDQGVGGKMPRLSCWEGSGLLKGLAEAARCRQKLYEYYRKRFVGCADKPGLRFAVHGTNTVDGRGDRFGNVDLAAGCKICIYRKMTASDKVRIRSKAYHVSSAFVVWNEEGPDRKGRFFINLSRQSKKWDKRPLRMEKWKNLLRD